VAETQDLVNSDYDMIKTIVDDVVSKISSRDVEQGLLRWRNLKSNFELIMALRALARGKITHIDAETN